MQNQITLSNTTFAVKGKNRPFSNNFVQTKVITEQKGFCAVVVTCTENSREPGREYYCEYTLKGTMITCYTLN